MIFTFGNYTVDIDVEKTKQTYEKLPLVSQRCSCDNCKNFEKNLLTPLKPCVTV